MPVLPLKSLLSLLFLVEPKRTRNYHRSLQVFLVICYSNFRLENSVAFKLHDVNQLCTLTAKHICAQHVKCTERSADTLISQHPELDRGLVMETT
jgi:hypothetical protein